VREAEIVAGRMLDPPGPVARVLKADGVAQALAFGAPTQRTLTRAAHFTIGDRVRTRRGHVLHHTRLLQYASGKVGRIDRVHDVHVFPDTHAQGLGEQPQWLYTAAFEERELWGDESPTRLTVSID